MDHYKLLISNEGKTIEISSHDKNWVEEKEKQYKNQIDNFLSVSKTKVAVKEITETEKNNKKSEISPTISVNEFYRKFIHQKNISRPDMVTIFVYYLTSIKKAEAITTNDIKNLFKEVGYPNWVNLNYTDILSKAKQKAFLNLIDNNWSITITGEDYVLNLLSEINEK